MRNSKIIQIEGRGEVTVKELSVKGLYLAYQSDNKVQQLQSMVDDAVTPGFSELQNWYPSELEQVVDAFLAVNESFFAIARKLKVDGLIVELVKSLLDNLPPLFATLFNQGIATHGTTGGQSL
jgi:hypothetical protein